MYNVVVEWLDEHKIRARFSLPGRQEWRAEHIDALIQILAEIRSEMAPRCRRSRRRSTATRCTTALRHPAPFVLGRHAARNPPPALGWMDFVLPSLERARICAS